MSIKSTKIFISGDIVGREGRHALTAFISNLKKDKSVDIVIANAENASGGLGLDAKSAKELLAGGIDVITLGDHAWKFKDLEVQLSQEDSKILRPHNFNIDLPGSGWGIYELAGLKLGVLNIIGRVFMGNLVACPFECAEKVLKEKRPECDMIICDFHAEASSEKISMGRFLNGKVSLVCGTHTHVQTSDEQILSEGTGFISDLGMTGSTNGVLGMSWEVAKKRFLTGAPAGYKLAKGAVVISGVIVEIESSSGKCIGIERVFERVS